MYYFNPLTERQDAFDQFQTFGYNQFTSNGLSHAEPLTPQKEPSISANNGFDLAPDMNDDSLRRGSNSDDDENMTLAQSRRKAQNRAAYVSTSQIAPLLTCTQPTSVPRTQRTARQRPRNQTCRNPKARCKRPRRKRASKTTTAKSRDRERDT